MMPKRILTAIRVSLLFLVVAQFQSLAHGACPDLLQHSMKRLHSAESINLCDAFQGKPLLVINTASHCGFTPQFSKLEEIYQAHKASGLNVLGVASNSFNQEASSEQETAEVCYVNYGVSFTMLAPVDVKGEGAHPLFKSLAAQSQPPSWNFNKYLVDSSGKVVKYYPSRELPTVADIEAAILEQQ